MAYHKRVVIVRLVACTAAFAMALSCNDKGKENYPPQQRQQLAELTLGDSITAQDSTDLDHTINSAGLTAWHNAPCNYCKDPTEVQIRAIAKTTDIQAGSGPAHRRIVAAIRNRGNEDVWHAPSHVTFKAHGVYLFYVARAASPNKNTVWGITRLKVGRITPPIGDLEECEHTPNPSRVDDANFYDCGDVHKTASHFSLMKTAYAAPRTTPPAAAIPKRGWISCDPDCCTGAGTYSGPAF